MQQQKQLQGRTLVKSQDKSQQMVCTNKGTITSETHEQSSY
jgi:hypothetical protein